MRYTGSCHCGRIAYEIEGEIQSLLECNCSLCSRRGYLLFFVPRTALTLKTPEADMATYTFNRHAIQHRFCPNCGCAPFGESKDAKGVDHVAVNARCLEGVDLTGIERHAYDGRSV